jgi:hypothetical protein
MNDLYVSPPLDCILINFIFITVYSLPPRELRSVPRAVSREHSDGSGPLFNIYLKMKNGEDNQIADRWQKDADGILIFVSCLLVSIPRRSAQLE